MKTLGSILQAQLHTIGALSNQSLSSLSILQCHTLIDTLKFFGNLYDSCSDESHQFSHLRMTQLFVELMPLNMILGHGLSSENKIANEMALNIYGKLSLGSDESTVKFSKTL